ncbi:hypothetical protein BH11PLA2_BH11PLA2_04990 [soil metagenome]
MSYPDAFLTALALTLAGTFAVTAYLHRPLKRLLPEICSSLERGAFWSACIDIILVLTPLMALLLGRENASFRPSLIGLQVADLLWAPMLGLIFAVLVVAIIVATLSKAEPEWQATIVPKDQRTGLNRLLDKVDTIRAREAMVQEEST